MAIRLTVSNSARPRAKAALVRGACNPNERLCVGDSEVSITTLRPSGSLLSAATPCTARSYWPRVPMLTRVDQSGSCSSTWIPTAARYCWTISAVSLCMPNCAVASILAWMPPA